MLAKQLASLFILFAEPGFPMVDVSSLVTIDGAHVVRSVAELREALKPGRVLVWRHGSAFPAEAWEDISRFLDSGGSLLYLGGEPFTRPVRWSKLGGRKVEPRTIAYLRELKLNQCYRVDVSDGRMRAVNGKSTDFVPLASPCWAAVLEPRLCDTKDFKDEDGSPGARDGEVRPLWHAWKVGDDERFPSAAAGLVIERYRGRWAGGRWVFWSLSTPPEPGDLARLVNEAAKEPIEFQVDPTFGCFHEGERPSVVVRMHRPRGYPPSGYSEGTSKTDYQGTTRPAIVQTEFEVSLAVSRPTGGEFRTDPILVSCRRHANERIELPEFLVPGLYHVRAAGKGLPEVETGFWIYDEELFVSGDELSVDGYSLRRNGKPEPVVGTTVMSGLKHRKFLFEPNAAVWDDTFAELAACKMNMVRTGIWSGYRKAALDPGVVDEAWLRGLEAYYLSARRHGIPVIFTFFAFLPETWGGENPYFDPRAIEAQRAYVAAVASRFKNAKEIMWDLINEPSFSSAKHLWQCRPNGDEFEKKAFIAWLEKSYGDDDEDWKTVVRRRWRLTSADPISLPTTEDFDDRAVFEKRRPYRAADYVQFAQESFTQWTGEMTRAIRDAGSHAAITVGQDEGGLTQRPSPLVHHHAVDFTSMHAWWLNDSLLMDGLGAKARGKPLLISETGIMQRELLSGEAIRSPDEAAKLLSRKIGYAFASRAFGVIQWCYDVNPYMASDNEVAIGLRPGDGSYRPEHRVLREAAAFVARNTSLFDGAVEPEIVMIVPTGDIWSPRDHAGEAVRRAVDALEVDLGMHVQWVPDHRAAIDLGKPRAIILPACRGVSDVTWNTISAAMKNGSTLFCTGWFETNDAGLPADRLGLKKRLLSLNEKSGEGAMLRFSRNITESWYAAAGNPVGTWIEKDGLRVWHHPLPLEWSESPGMLRSFYAAGLERAKVYAPSHNRWPPPPGVLVSRLRFAKATLVVMINETPREQIVQLVAGQSPVMVPAGESRMAWLDDKESKIIDMQGAHDQSADRNTP
ncbi:MAG: cellulase family glycosylhydrolase [Planctomycetes bacterium]|nr:cellulase family glycosylhydrolase [Planctomycetota bacterium]